ncbi:fimbrial protein, partial [Escherichia coli]
EIPVFHSSYIHSSHCNKVSSNNKNHAFCYQRKGIFILCVCCVCCVCFICAI